MYYRILLLIIVFTAGCSTMPEQLPKLITPQPLLTQWSLSAKLGIKSYNNGGTFTVEWLQDSDTYSIDFQGPLGQASGRLVKTKSHVTYYASDGSKAQATNAANLLEAQAGIILPVESIIYWLQAKPSPLLAQAKIRHNDDGYSDVIQQGDWQVTYHRYSRFNDFILPTSLTITKPSQEMQAKLIIRQWKSLK